MSAFLSIPPNIMIYVICIAWPLIVAMMEAMSDYKAIKAKKGAAGKKAIDHGAELTERVVMVGAPLLIIFVVYLWIGGMEGLTWDKLCLLPVAWASFTSPFRARLNTLRGKALTYVSRSNNYDSLYLRLMDGDVDMAGRMAYAVEAVAFVAGTVGYWITNTH